MTDRLTIKQVSEQMNARYSAEKLKEISDMLSQSNDLLDALGPYEHRDISRWQRAKNWCGWKLIKAGAYLMGEHAPYME